MIRIKNAAGILSTDVPTGRVLWVDQLNGVDKLAMRGRLTIPFKTLTGAKDAASSGDTIMVLPGTYDEKNLLKDGVNWHFFRGANVVYSGNEAGGIFDTSEDGSDAAVDCSVTGHGEFSLLNSTGSGHVVHFATGEQLVIEADTFLSHDDCVKVSGASSGLLRIRVAGIINSTNGNGIYVANSNNSARIEADSVHASSGSALRIVGGNVHVIASLLRSGSTAAVNVQSGSGLATLDVLEIVSDTYIGILYAATNATLHVINARIKAGGSVTYGRAIDIRSDISAVAPALIKLTGCVLVASGDADTSIETVASPAQVQLNGGGATNLAPSGGITFIGGSMPNDAAIS